MEKSANTHVHEHTGERRATSVLCWPIVRVPRNRLGEAPFRNAAADCSVVRMSSEVRDKAVEKFSLIRPETAPIFEDRPSREPGDEPPLEW